MNGSSSAACAIVLLAFASPAHAQTETLESAKALYVEGKQLRDAGDLPRSLEKLEAAHALYPTAVTALEVGRALALLGRIAKAVEVLRSVERINVRPTESQKSDDARAEAKRLLAMYRPRLGTLVVRTERPRSVASRLRVDGEIVAPSVFEGEDASPAAQASVELDPGPHVVSLERGSEKVSEDVVLREGDVVTIALHLPELPKAPAAPSAAVIAEPPPPRGGAFPVLAYAGFGVGAAAAILGTTTGVITLARATTLKRECAPDGACPSGSDLTSARTLGTVSTISFAVAGAGALLGVIALVSAHQSPSPKQAWIAPSIGPRAVGLVGGWRWH